MTFNTQRSTFDAYRAAGQVPPVSQIPLIRSLWPARRRIYKRRGNFLHYPEEKPGQALFPKRGYSFLCGGGSC